MTAPFAASVVIPTRDRSDLLGLTLHTVLAQRDVDLDVVVVDDGGGHDTAAVVHAVADRRVRLLRNTERPGPSGARNCGIAAAQCEWVAFCDDDDLWAPDKLAHQLAAAAQQHAAWVYAGAVTVDLDLQVLSGRRPPSPDEVVRDLSRHNSVPAGASNVVVRADALARAGPFDTTLRTSEDWDQWMRLARSAGCPACVPRPLVALRIHPRMASRTAEGILTDIDIVARRYGMRVDRARHHRWAAWMALEEGRGRQALRHYACAVAAGDWRSAGRAVVAVLDRGIVQRRRIAPHDTWAREAQCWLDLLRASGSRQLDSDG